MEQYRNKYFWSNQGVEMDKAFITHGPVQKEELLVKSRG
jgi:hypothetical protein